VTATAGVDVANSVIALIKGQRKAPADDAGQSVPPGKDAQQAANRMVQGYGLAERAAEFTVVF